MTIHNSPAAAALAAMPTSAIPMSHILIPTIAVLRLYQQDTERPAADPGSSGQQPPVLGERRLSGSGRRWMALQDLTVAGTIEAQPAWTEP